MKYDLTFGELIDTDSDGLPDWWEQEFGYDPNVWDNHLNLDPDGDALNNFEECYAYEWGSDPFKKDIFLEFDYTMSKASGESNIPPEKYVNKQIIFIISRFLFNWNKNL